jgi:glycosyltransferase involved in cell wall biosynthesis
VSGPVTVDIAGAQMGGAARLAGELRHYLTRSGRPDVAVIGANHHVSAAWLIRRECRWLGRGRRLALNNVSFVQPGGPRWVLLHNALHFVTGQEAARLEPSLRSAMRRDAAVVRMAARRADQLVVPCTAMAERVASSMPAARNRIAVRLHPVSAPPPGAVTREAVILCPVLFAPYKRMHDRLAELLAAVDAHEEQDIQVRITAGPGDLPPDLAAHPRLEFLGRVNPPDLRQAWARSRAIYFPTGLESFGYPLAEARVNGQPVIARDTAQNREIAGPALCGFEPGDPDSLRQAVKTALTDTVSPDPAPFDPDAYFTWMLGDIR